MTKNMKKHYNCIGICKNGQNCTHETFYCWNFLQTPKIFIESCTLHEIFFENASLDLRIFYWWNF